MIGVIPVYLTYEQYRDLGGKADEMAFPRLEQLARKKLDYWTQNRITAPSDDVRLCMLLIIEKLEEIYSGAQDVSSFSNDGITVSLAGALTDAQKISEVYDQIVEILPVELVSLAVNYEN